MDFENKGYPQPQQGMAMPMPPSYDQSGGYPPQPQPGMYPPMPGQMHYVPQQQPPMVQEPVPPTIIVTPQVGPDPSMMTCPSCRQTVVTRMEYEPSTRTHVMAGLCCLFGCWLCCWMPYCMDSCRNGNHYCPSCGSYLGTYKS